MELSGGISTRGLGHTAERIDSHDPRISGFLSLSLSLLNESRVDSEARYTESWRSVRVN